MWKGLVIVVMVVRVMWMVNKDVVVMGLKYNCLILLMWV